jgi:hypothetical protein
MKDEKKLSAAVPRKWLSARRGYHFSTVRIKSREDSVVVPRVHQMQLSINDFSNRHAIAFFPLM